jgi:hypothetical protein
MQISETVLLWFLGGICVVLAGLVGVIWSMLRGEINDLKEKIKTAKDDLEKHDTANKEIVMVIFEKIEKNLQASHDNDASIQSHDAKLAAAKDRMDNIEEQIRDLREERR